MDEPRREALAVFAASLGHGFADPSLLDAALCHSSYVHEHAEDGPPANERLEYLGDAVLELCVTRLLYFRFPEASEGELSKARSGLVNESRLASLARSLGLGGFLLLGRGEELQNGRDKPSLLADALEATLAAVYLDAGLEAADAIVQRLFGPLAARAIQRATEKDYKTRVQELVQDALHVTPRYQLLESSGPDHDKTFRVAILLEGEPLTEGVGKSKKEAEQQAAREGLLVLAQRGIPAE